MDKLHTILYDSSLAIVSQDTSTVEGYSSLQNYYRAIAPYNTEYIPYTIFYPTNSDNNVGVPAEYMLMSFIETTTVDGSTYYTYETAFPPAVTGSARANKIDVTVAFIVKDDDLIGVSKYDEDDEDYNDTTYIAAQLLLDYTSAVSGNYVRVFNTETDWSFDGSVWTDTDDITITDLIEHRSDTASYTLRKGTSTTRPTHAPNNTETIIAILNDKVDASTVLDNHYTKTESESRYVNTTDDVMTGTLIVAGLTTSSGDVDINLATKVDKVTGSSLVTDTEIAHLEALDTQAELDAKFDLKIDISTKGENNGVAPLNASGIIDSIYIPGAYDDYEEYDTYADLPTTGVEGLLYVVLADEEQGGNTSTYRWTGSVYTLISNELSASEIKVLYESNANTNAYTDTEKTKLGTVETDSQENDIEVIKVNSVSQPITAKVVDLDIPVNTSDLVNDGNGSGAFITINDVPGGGDMLKAVYDTDNNGVVDKAEVSLQNLVVELTYDTAGKFYATVTGLTITDNYEVSLLFPNTTSDLTTAVTVSLDGVAGTYKALKYDDTENAVIVKHTQDLQTKATYNGTEFIMKGTPLINQDFTFDESINSTYGNGKAINGIPSLKEVNGLSLNNISLYGNFDTDTNTDGLADGWTSYLSGTFSLTSGVQSFTPTGTNGGVYTTASMISGDSYRVCALVKSDKSTVRITAGSGNNAYHSGSGNFELLSVITSNTSGGAFTLQINDSDTTGYTEIQVKKYMIIPITNTPLASKSASEIDAIIPSYFEGEKHIEDFTLTSVGVNLLNEATIEIGTINTTTGEDAISTSNGRSDFIGVKPTTDYRISLDGSTNNVNVYEYDSNYNFILYTSAVSTLETTSNTSYIRIVKSILYTSKELFQVNEGTDVIPTVPYNSPTTPFKLTTDLYSVGDIRDIAYPLNGNWWKKAYIGVDTTVIKATTTWSITDVNTTTHAFYKDLTSLLDYTSTTLSSDEPIATLKIGTITFTPVSRTYQTANDEENLFTISTSGNIVISVNKTTYATSGDFETYLQANDVTFIYELNDTITTEIEYDGSLIQESNTTFIQGNDNFATEYDITLNMNVNAVVSALTKKLIRLQEEVDDNSSSGLFAYLSSTADTTCTTALTWYPINGTFTNEMSNDFSTATVNTPGIKYTGSKTKAFEIDYHATVSGDSNGVTIELGVKKNGTIITGSIMGNYLKTVNEPQSASGTVVVELKTDDEIQLVVNADGSGDIVTVDYYTTSIREF